MTSRSKTLNVALRVGPALGYTLFIFIAGTGKVPPAAASHDKWLHAFAFAVMVLLCHPAVQLLGSLRRSASAPGLDGSASAPSLDSIATRRSIATSWLISVSLGALLELVQHFIPYRRADGWDLLANTMGASAASLLLVLWYRWAAPALRAAVR